MRKKIVSTNQQKTKPPEQDWLNLEEIARVELSSEDINHPIESALLAEQDSQWRAASPGKQSIRLLFDHPQQLKKISLSFQEHHIERTQEYVLRYLTENESSFQEIVRQQWNFSPEGNTIENEEHQVELNDVTELELIIIPDINGSDARASLMQLQLA